MRFILKSTALLPTILIALIAGQASAQDSGEPAGQAAAARRVDRADPRPERLPQERRQDPVDPTLGRGPWGRTERGWPRIDPGVYPPRDFTVGNYTTTEVSLRWWHTRAPETRVLRSIDRGPWSLIQTFGPLPPGAYASFRDQSARINAENCYQISVSDGINPFGAQTSPIRCAMTRDGRAIPVRRLRLRLYVATAANAGTDEPVEVRLQAPSWFVPTVTNWRPAGNSSWLDSTADDFERGSSLSYVLTLTNISEMSDITGITLAKPGSDDMCVARIELWINDQPGFTRDYSQSATSCEWVGGERMLGVSFADLRAHPPWNLVGDSTIAGISPEDLRAIIMAQFGHALHGIGELRNGSALTTSFVDQGRLSVRVPIRVHDASFLGDVDSDVHFDLVLSTVDGRSDLTVENIDADSSDLVAHLLPVPGWNVLWEVSTTIEAAVAAVRLPDVNSAPEGWFTCFRPNAGIGVCARPLR